MGKKPVDNPASRRTSAATRRSRLVFPLPRGPITIWCGFELPVHSRSISTIDSNSTIRTQNDVTSSPSVRNPGLYFRGAVTAIAPFSVPG